MFVVQTIDANFILSKAREMRFKVPIKAGEPFKVAGKAAFFCRHGHLEPIGFCGETFLNSQTPGRDILMEESSSDEGESGLYWQYSES